MNKTTMLGVGVVGIGLAAAYMKLKGSSVPSDIAEAVSHVDIWNEANSIYLTKEPVMSYVSMGGPPASVYILTWAAGSAKAVEGFMVAYINASGQQVFEGSLMAPTAVRFYYDMVLKMTLTTGLAYQLFIV